MAAKAEPVRVYTEAQVHRRERSALKVDGATPLAALCLSGGGIRSAAFCLGALQALARKKLLTEFHYLSTVSGGGYVGGWLTRCISETAEQGSEVPGKPAPSDIGSVQDAILGARGQDEPEELQNLRHYTNFLTPHPGLASDDSWAGAILWLRNTLINWMVFFPLLLAVAAIPVAYFAAICALRAAAGAGIPLADLAALAGLPCLGVAVYHSCIDLPSHSFRDTAERERRLPSNPPDGAAVRRRIVWWVAAWAAFVPLAIAPVLQPAQTYACARAAFLMGDTACQDGPLAAAQLIKPPVSALVGTFPTLALLPLFTWLVCLAAFGAAFWTIRGTYKDATEEDRQNREKQLRPFKTNLPAWAFSSLASAALLWLGAWLAEGQNGALLAIVGPPWVVTADILRSTLYVAFRQDGLRSDIDREWLARLNASKLRPTLGYAGVAAAALLLPGLVLDTSVLLGWIIAVAGFATGPVAALLGKSVMTAAVPDGTKDKPWMPLDTIIGVAVAVFAAAMIMLAGRLAALIALLWVPAADAAGSATLSRAAVGALVLAVGAGFAGFFIGKAVDLNRFSMHAVYRNRLVRAFLGSARRHARRKPDAYTGFDPNDDVRIAEAFCQRTPPRLFPVVNVALNRTTGVDTARAERKAESFTITPLHCGSPGLLRPPPQPAAGAPPPPPHPKAEGAYVETAKYAGESRETGPGDQKRGIRLGTAITISGAAASPDMGYRSSPYTAFIMTLFNVRLGAWLPNPAAPRPTPELMRSTGPRNAVGTLLDELGGRSGVGGDFVYLSDGGHFDNLGLYEMLRRRCAFIVVVDAGRDPDYGYFDLGHTLQHALVDLGVTVDFLQPLKTAEKLLQPHGAYAKITYAGDPPMAGELLYLKPWLPPDAPTSLQAFHASNPSFPHETTLNQFFTESDFESYRALGEAITKTALDQGTTTLPPCHAAKLDKIFTELRHCAKVAAVKPSDGPPPK